MLSAFIASALIAVVAPANADWPQPGMSETHAGFNKLETVLGAGNVGKLERRWSFSTGGQITAPIAVQGKVALVNSADGYLYAVNAETGAQAWKFRTFTEGAAQDVPIVSGAHVFVACHAGGSVQQNGICGLGLSSGTLVWSYSLNCSCTPPAGLAAAPAVVMRNTAAAAGRQEPPGVFPGHGEALEKCTCLPAAGNPAAPSALPPSSPPCRRPRAAGHSGLPR